MQNSYFVADLLNKQENDKQGCERVARKRKEKRSERGKVLTHPGAEKQLSHFFKYYKLFCLKSQ